jgi:hypothetical protein
MPRRARIAPRDYVFYVLTRGNNRQGVFLDAMGYQTYLEILKKYKEKLEFKVYLVRRPLTKRAELVLSLFQSEINNP